MKRILDFFWPALGLVAVVWSIKLLFEKLETEAATDDKIRGPGRSPHERAGRADQGVVGNRRSRRGDRDDGTVSAAPSCWRAYAAA